MISPFSDSIICNHKNLIRIADRRKPVCDRDRGPVLRKLFQALLDPALTLIVKRTGRLVQNQYRRILKKYSCNRNPLLLSTRQTGSSFSYKAVISIRQGHDKFMDICLLRRIDNFFHRCPRFSISNIFPDRSTEQIDILLYQSDLASQTFQCQLSYILPVDRDHTSGHIVKSWKQGTDRRLSTSRRSHKGNGSASRDLKRYPIQYRRIIIAIMERNIFIFHFTLYIFKWLCIRCIYNLRLRLHNIQKAPETGKTFLHHLGKLHKNLDRTDKNSDVKRIHGKICSFHFPMCDQPSAEH